MKALAAAAVAAALAGSALFLPVATEAQNPPWGIPGYLDPSTGMFTSRAALAPAATALQRKGTITVTVTVTIGSNIPKSAPLTCSVSIGSFDTEYSNSAGGDVPLTRSAKGGTCKIVVPFIFEIATAKTQMNIFAEVIASVGTNPTLSYNTTFNFSPFPVSNGNKNVAVALAM